MAPERVDAREGHEARGVDPPGVAALDPVQPAAADGVPVGGLLLRCDEVWEGGAKGGHIIVHYC